MARDDERSLAPLYLTVGALAAIGAGYLVWRYVLSEDTKDRVKGAVSDGARSAKRAVAAGASKAKEATMEAAGKVGSAARSAMHR